MRLTDKQKVLRFLEARVNVCRKELARWQAKRDAGECEQINVATERSATFEAEHILAEVRELFGLSRYPDEAEAAVIAARIATAENAVRPT